MATVLAFDVSLTRTGITSAGDCGYRHSTIVTLASEPLPARLRRLCDGAFNAVGHWGCAFDLVLVEIPGFAGGHSAPGLDMAIGAVLAGLPSGLRVETVSVSTWRSGLGLKYPRGAGKGPSIAFAQSLGIDLPHLTARSAKVDDNVAEAFCIAEWGLRFRC